jgi:predicted RNA binding protein YcfA (HicA-like mRNA interferase family)
VASGTQVVKALQRAGFTITRVNGSRDLLPGTMRGILKTVRMTPDEFRELL